MPPPGLPAPTGDAWRDAAALLAALMRAGLRWELGAAGPDRFDCWSMARLIEAHLFAREVAALDALAAPLKGLAARAKKARGQWQPRAGAPCHGDGVLLSNPEARPHVGVWLDLDRGVVAHMAEHQHFSVDGLLALKMMGYRNPQFFEWIK